MLDAALKHTVIFMLGAMAGAAAVWAHGYGPVHLSGAAEVIDGDNIRVGGYNVRLAGIDAPELPVRNGKECRKLLSRHECVNRSGIALLWRIGGERVRCWIIGDGLSSHGDWDRPLGVCFHGETDLNAWMLRQCHADLPEQPEHRIWRYADIVAERDCQRREPPVARLESQ